MRSPCCADLRRGMPAAASVVSSSRPIWRLDEAPPIAVAEDDPVLTQPRKRLVGGVGLRDASHALAVRDHVPESAVPPRNPGLSVGPDSPRTPADSARDGANGGEFFQKIAGHAVRALDIRGRR